MIAGFEGADHRNSSGTPVAMLDVTGHAKRYRANYAMLRALGIRAVRESVGWSRAEHDGRFDFGCALRRAEAARDAGLTIVWTLWHYGLPDGLDLFHPALTDRFAAFAHAAAAALDDRSLPAPIFCPVNEISFVAWAACESCFMHPHRGAPGRAASARGYALKQRLVHAALAGCDAIRDVIPSARMLHVDPLIHAVAPPDEPSRADEAARTRAFQFQAWDMLTGRLAPELGGAPRYVDYVGVNYYHGNQFEIGTERRLHWHLRDPRRIAFSALLHEAFGRYGRPLVIAETSHFGIGRDRWLVEIAADVRRAMREGVPVAGLCLYPVTDRPDWERPGDWHHSGLWDRVVANDGACFERLHLPYLRALRHVQHAFGDDERIDAGDAAHDAYALVVFAAGVWREMSWHRRALIEALAAHWTLVLVEGGAACPPDRASLRSRDSPSTGIVVVHPAAPDTVDAAHDDGAAETVARVLAALACCGARTYGVWLHTPLALPVVAHLAPDVVAYSPDEAPAYVRADPRFAQRHEALRRVAGVVGDATREALERARRSPWRAAARATLDHPGAAIRAAERRSANARRARRRDSCQASHDRAECVIVGAGVAGLSAALHYGPGSVLIERDVAPGASRRSMGDHGFLLDLAAHVLDRRDALGPLYARLLGNNVEWRAPRVDVGDSATRRSPAPAPFRDAFGQCAEAIGYPRHDATQALIDGFLPLLDSDLVRGVEVVRILPHERAVVLDDLRLIRYDRLIVTLPLPALLALCDDALPADVADAASRLRTLSLRSVDIGARGAATTDRDWLLDPGDAIFDRVFVQSNVAPWTRRRGGYALVCEIVHGRSRPLALHGSALVRQCIDDCVRTGVIASHEAVVVTHEIDLPVACVVDDDPDRASLRLIERWLAAYGIAFTGSRGEWEPGRCASQLLSGRHAALAARCALWDVAPGVAR